MNADLEETLNGLGPEYRAVVDRLRAGRVADAGVEGVIRVTRDKRGWGFLAASLLIAVALAVWFVERPSTFNLQPSTCVACNAAPREYRMTTDEMIATQRADGSWANDFLTRHNADALKDLDDPRAQVAYKKAMRNLRLRQAL